jgi:hypothetical protein
MQRSPHGGNYRVEGGSHINLLLFRQPFVYFEVFLEALRCCHRAGFVRSEIGFRQFTRIGQQLKMTPVIAK